MAELIAQVAQVVECTEAEGPGRRFAVWFQGCPLRCPGCCNPEMLPFSGGAAARMSDLLARLTAAAPEIEGISLLGGEPFAHLAASTALARAARDLDLSVMTYSGYTLSEVRARNEAAAFLSLIDVLVDGPYLRDQPESHRRWVGSANQQVHFLTDRYRSDDPIWSRQNTIELRLCGGELTLNGFPAPAAVGLWQRTPRSIGGSR